MPAEPVHQAVPRASRCLRSRWAHRASVFYRRHAALPRCRWRALEALISAADSGHAGGRSIAFHALFYHVDVRRLSSWPWMFAAFLSSWLFVPLVAVIFVPDVSFLLRFLACCRVYLSQACYLLACCHVYLLECHGYYADLRPR